MRLEPLEGLRDELGLGAWTGGELRIGGDDPVLATRFRVGEAAATALAAVGVAVTDLWEQRTGRKQQVSVDVRAAAASLLSFMLARVVEGESPGYGDRAVLTDVFPTRDAGWFFFHGSFPANTQRATELLGCSSACEKTELARAIARWDAQELEDCFASHGLCGAKLRTQSQWEAHPQGMALAAHPVVEVIQIGDSDPEPIPANGATPLAGVRVLDLTRVLAGPTCGRTLAQHGADVLRISSPNLPSIPHFVMDTSCGKRSAHLDLTQRGDVERLHQLIRSGDVFVQGYRAGALERLGFGPENVSALRPGIVYASINCYGHVGDWSARPGWEQLAQTVTGISAEQGGRVPALIPAAPTDYTTGYLAALGTLVALKRRASVGGSYHVRVSLCRTGMWIQTFGRTDEPGAGLSRDWLDSLLMQTDAPFGRVEHLAPVVKLSETPARWARPTVPLGTHAPEWETRASNGRTQSTSMQENR